MNQLNTSNTKSGSLLNQPESIVELPGKYVIVQLNDKEQVITLPFETKHSAAFEAFQKTNPTAQAVSAGFYIADAEFLFVGGGSDTLGLDSRPQDESLVKAFLGGAK